MKIMIEIEGVRNATEEEVMEYSVDVENDEGFFDGYLVLFDRWYRIRSMKLASRGTVEAS